MADVDLSQLRALAAVVDEGSFDAAAAALHLTPSAVSQRIKALEQSAGRVLVRRTKPTEATEAGHAYLRLARQVEALVQDVRVEVDPDEQRLPTIPLAVNGDSLATWVLPALASLSGTAYFDVRREDEGRTAELLRSGTVMAADHVRLGSGARAAGRRRLGTMRYRPMASPAFVAHWFADGVDAASLAVAPVVVFDRNDDLQDAYLRQRSRRRLGSAAAAHPGVVAVRRGDRARSGLGDAAEGAVRGARSGRPARQRRPGAATSTSLSTGSSGPCRRPRSRPPLGPSARPPPST